MTYAAGGVTICAVYPRDGNACEPGEGGRLTARHGVYFVLGNHDKRLRDRIRCFFKV